MNASKFPLPPVGPSDTRVTVSPERRNTSARASLSSAVNGAEETKKTVFPLGVMCTRCWPPATPPEPVGVTDTCWKTE